ncbi:MAG: glycosyl hydrolase 53 family protein [Paludibacter sp.]|nr:glycosyl hydrolase 53 family protein [Paludibacter sp.]
MKSIALKTLLIFISFIWLVLPTGCKETNPIKTPTDTTKVDTTFAKGADVSWVTQMEASGMKFYNAQGSETECMTLLKSLGMNSIRLRVWVNPADGWCNSQDLLTKALRAKNLGMHIMIDFHYSDSWADPSKQTKPAAWINLTGTNLETAVATHTTSVLNLLKTNNITIDWVQVGNETSNGMLWDDGKASINMQKYAKLTNAGYNAVKAVYPNAKVIVHLNNGYDKGLYKWLFDGLVANGAKWDVIGMSVYPYWFTTSNDWQTCNQQCLDNMNYMVSLYGKEVMIVECGMSWDSPTVCQSFLTDLIAKTKSVTGGKGIGVFYWEPECYNNWQSYSMGAFDNSGKPTVALDAFK